jgi:DHA2 family multidrug resistance protein
MGYSAQMSGLATTPRGIGSLVSMPLVGVLVGMVDSRLLVLVGTSLFGLSGYLLGGLNLDIGMQNIVWVNVLQGASMSFIMVPMMTMSVARLKNVQMGNASSLYNLVRNIGGGIGISLATTFISRGAQARQALMVHNMTPYDPAYQERLSAFQAGLTPLTGAPQAQQQAYVLLQRVLVQQATLSSFMAAFRWVGLGLALAGPLIFLMRTPEPHKQRGAPPVEL